MGNWRYAFYIVVIPGILLGVWALFMPEPRRATRLSPRPPSWSDYGELFRVPSYTLNCIGMTFMTFAMGGLAYWAPAFLENREAKAVFGLIPPATFFGVLTASLGLAATLLGGIVGDALRKRFPGSYFLVSGAAMCLAFPLLLLVVYLPFPLAWWPLAGFVFCLFFNTGPTNTILANVIRSDLRARGFAINILVIHLFGDAAAPWFLGRIIGKENRYDVAFTVVAVTVLVGGLAWLWGTAYLQRDTDRANAESSGTASA